MKKNIVPILGFFFFYIIVALGWWFYTLEKQNQKIFIIQTQGQHLPYAEFKKIEKIKHKNTLQHIGEGVISLIIIVLGAGILYFLLKRAFNAVHKERNFILDISHELQAPLSSIQFNLETLRKRTIIATTQHQLIGSTLRETKCLDILYSNVIATLRLTEAQVLPNNFKKILLFPLLYKMIKHFQTHFPSYSFSLSNNTRSDVSIMGDKNLIFLLFQNLIDNAIKYSFQENAHIYVNIQEKNNFIKVFIKDEGIGIDAQHRKHIFQKFFRVKDKHICHTKGAGLGLYVVQQVMLLHKGHIETQNNQPRGSIFMLQFKKA